MKILFFFLVLSSLFYSCSSNEVEIDKIAEESNPEFDIVEEMEEPEWPNNEPEYVDSLVPFKRNIFLKSSFESEQILSDVKHLLYKDEIKLFKDIEFTEEIGDLKKGKTIRILEEQIEYFIDDEGFPGYKVKVITDDGLEGYISDNYLSILPFHSKSENNYNALGDYARQNLHLIDSVIEEGAYYGETEMGFESEWATTTYFFENGISLKEEHGYESGSTIMFIPNITSIEGFFILNEIYPLYKMIELTEGFPSSTYKEIKSEDWGIISFESDFENNKGFQILNSVNFFFGDGCGEWFYIRVKNNGVEIEAGGGC